ncbi:uncharacterized protein LOC134722682 [Mytilus trossulus]|uniref:uncharacterized protein LOC134722682 n=1 Tax=Mytilus trossulus TaxID=6551 RepID=UPI003006DFE7
MGFQILLFVLLTVCVVHSYYQAKPSRCLFPCEFRENIPLLGKQSTIWILNNPSFGTYTNLSRPIGDQTSISECIMRQGPFFIISDFGLYFCFKFIALTATDWFEYFSVGSETLLPFCEMCDASKFSGPVYFSARLSAGDYYFRSRYHANCLLKLYDKAIRQNSRHRKKVKNLEWGLPK